MSQNDKEKMIEEITLEWMELTHKIVSLISDGNSVSMTLQNMIKYAEEIKNDKQ